MTTESQITKLGDDVKKQFEQIGNDARDQILKDFNKALDKDIDSLRSTLNKIVEAQNKKLLMESQQQLQETILQEFSGNIFGQILSDALLPMAFNGFSGRGGFRQSGSQSLFDIGKAISRAQTRNG